MREPTYTLAEIRETFWQVFDGAGEMFFTCDGATEERWAEFHTVLVYWHGRRNASEDDK